MKKFKKSLAKIIDYKLLARNLATTLLPESLFVDFGTGDCSLLKILRKKYCKEGLGVEIDDRKINYCRENGFRVIASDIRNSPPLLENIKTNLSIHAGFCLFNIFCFDEIKKLLEELYKIENVLEIFFEIQNPLYFSKKYLPSIRYTTQIGQRIIVSWNTPFSELQQDGVFLEMEYYDFNHSLIHSTLDKLYYHCPKELVRQIRLIGFSSVCEYFWPVRFVDMNEKFPSHYYFHLRKKYE